MQHVARVRQRQLRLDIIGENEGWMCWCVDTDDVAVLADIEPFWPCSATSCPRPWLPLGVIATVCLSVSLSVSLSVFKRHLKCSTGNSQSGAFFSHVWYDDQFPMYTLLSVVQSFIRWNNYANESRLSCWDWIIIRNIIVIGESVNWMLSAMLAQNAYSLACKESFAKSQERCLHTGDFRLTVTYVKSNWICSLQVLRFQCSPFSVSLSVSLCVSVCVCLSVCCLVLLRHVTDRQVLCRLMQWHIATSGESTSNKQPHQWSCLFPPSTCFSLLIISELPTHVQHR